MDKETFLPRAALGLAMRIAVILLIAVLIPPDALTAASAYLEIPIRQDSKAVLQPEIQITPLISYQGWLEESGSPVTGVRSMGFVLYNAESGGTAIWSEGPKSISVVDGLFQTALGDMTPFLINEFYQRLWIEVHVDGNILPRQRLVGVPYAFSLSPGARVEGNISSGSAVVEVQNSGSGQGLKTQAYGIGVDGSVLKVENELVGNGIAVWTKTTSSDSNLVVENLGSGPLIKGFGGDGGGEELRVDNDGSLYFEGALMGAFPRPAYSSGWVSLSTGATSTLTHNVGGNPDDYIIDMHCYDPDFDGINNESIGGDMWSDNYFGAYFLKATSTTIQVYRNSDDVTCDQFQIDIWLIK